ncbi:hypothetical protein PCCS19_30610 [Paenibacillus sp. CCS19]|nr:hypothetical protein PCCS19_30610 [Paenibacillus cellulosilyticus]
MYGIIGLYADAACEGTLFRRAAGWDFLGDVLIMEIVRVNDISERVFIANQIHLGCNGMEERM